EHGVCPTATNLEQTGMSAAQMLQTGRIAMLVDGSWAIQELATMGFPLGIAVMPKFKELVTIGQAHLHSAWEKTDHPEEAWKLVKYLSSREYQTNLIREGLWLPNRMDMYEDENIDDWFNPEVYPEEFRKAVPLFTEYGELWSGVIAPSEAMDIINEELDNFFLDRQDIDEVIDRMKRRVDPILQNQ
ncbi:MAG TPA: extracellular solute-binding protein, partial [Halanaerobiales bacterium]|nr:extracellular solute-binding protein [Halanaerobiales bacterium]